MSTQFIAFVAKGKLPPTSELTRAMSSRGWAVVLDTEQPLAELGGTLSFQIDGEKVPVEMAIAPAGKDGIAEADADAQVVASVLKNTDTRLVFSGEGESGRWAREAARTVGLLSCGAFVNPEARKLINFGR
jgi:hypothetical protein